MDSTVPSERCLYVTGPSWTDRETETGSMGEMKECPWRFVILKSDSQFRVVVFMTIRGDMNLLARPCPSSRLCRRNGGCGVEPIDGQYINGIKYQQE